MSQKTDLSRFLKRTEREGGRIDPILIARLVAAAALVAVALIVKLPVVVRVIFLILSALVAGYDVLLDAIDSVDKKDYFATPLIVVAVTVLAYVIGFAAEGAVMLIMYQVGLLLIAYVDHRTRISAMELLRVQDEDTVAHYRELLDDRETGNLELEETMRRSAGSVLKIAMVFAVVYAVVLPLASGYSFRVSIHRALMILIICTPMSVVAAMKLTGIVGLCFSAQQGVLFNRAKTMEACTRTNVAVFDKAGIFSEESPKLLSVQSDLLDKETFMNFAAHAVYYSEQPFAKAISDAYTLDYRLDVIDEFSEIPGSGVTLKIAGNPVILATAELLTSKGIRVPREQDEGLAYHLVIAGRYVGKLIISANVNDATTDLAENMRAAGVKRCVLLTEDSAETSQRLAEALKFNEVFGECDTAKKLKLIGDMCQGSDAELMYVYATGIEAHSAAQVDIRVSKKAKYADAVVQPEMVSSLPFALRICQRMREVATENAVFAIIVKAILIFLSITGWCNLWFAIFIDFVAALATMLNSIRVTSESLLTSMRRKTAQE